MPVYRLDCPTTGRRVRLLGLTSDGYARVQTLGSGTMPGFVFETRAARLHHLLAH